MSHSETVDSIELKILRLQNTQYLYGLSPDTILPIELASILIGLSINTIKLYVTRYPGKLPVITRVAGKVFFIKRDIDAYREKCRCVPTEVKKLGRPTKVEQRRRRLETCAQPSSASNKHAEDWGAA